jgi:vancomycin resistance protein VanJ
MKYMKALRRVVLALLDGYGLITAVILMPQIVVGEQSHLIGFVDSFAQLYWLPALLLLPLALILRSRRTVLLILPAALAWMITFGDHFIPKPSLDPLPDQTVLTVMTYNMLDNGRDPADVVAQIAEIDPDIVVVQELTPQRVDAFDVAFATVYPYRAFHVHTGFSRGLGVMSKYPITADRFWHYAFMPASLGHQRVQIDVEGQTLTLYNMHPIHPGLVGEFFNPEPRGWEIEAIIKDAQAESAPFMMAGDFNLPELSLDYQRITRAGFVDAYRRRGWGLGHTFTRGGAVPFLRLDYMFLGPGVDVSTIRVWPTGGGSDHRPVVAHIILQ